MADREPKEFPTDEFRYGTIDNVTQVRLATPKQLLRIYHAYLRAGLTDTDRLTEIANKFTKAPVDHWMDITFITASKWIQGIAAAEQVQARKRLANQYDPDRFA